MKYSYPIHILAKVQKFYKYTSISRIIYLSFSGSYVRIEIDLFYHSIFFPHHTVVTSTDVIELAKPPEHRQIQDNPKWFELYFVSVISEIEYHILVKP